MKYKFLCDFPPTGFKKGDEVSLLVPYPINIGSINAAILLKLGVIEEVKEEVKEEKWKPDFDNFYWALQGLRLVEYVWRNDDTDRSLWEAGLVFKTEEEAKAAAEVMKKALADFKNNKK